MDEIELTKYDKGFIRLIVRASKDHNNLKANIILTAEEATDLMRKFNAIYYTSEKDMKQIKTENK